MRALAQLGAVLLAVASTSAPASAAGPPAFVVGRTAAAPGEVVTGQLTDWPPGPVTIAFCGNFALRGDVDCALIESQAVSNDGTQRQVQLVVATPPVPCPCVVRAHNAGDAVVRAVPIEIVGVPVAPTVAPDPGSLQRIEVDADVRDATEGGAARLRAALGGRAPRTLVLTIRNVGVAVVDGLAVNVAVGRSRSSGEPMVPPEVEGLAPGASATYEVPFDLKPPAFGDYLVFGTVYGAGSPVTFERDTTNRPVLLAGALVLLAADAGAYVWSRVRRARTARSRRLVYVQASGGRTVPEHLRPGPPNPAAVDIALPTVPSR